MVKNRIWWRNKHYRNNKIGSLCGALIIVNYSVSGFQLQLILNRNGTWDCNAMDDFRDKSQEILVSVIHVLVSVIVHCREEYFWKHHRHSCPRFDLQSNLDISNSDISNSAKFEASLWIKNTFWLLSPTII